MKKDQVENTFSRIKDLEDETVQLMAMVYVAYPVILTFIGLLSLYNAVGL